MLINDPETEDNRRKMHDLSVVKADIGLKIVVIRMGNAPIKDRRIPTKNKRRKKMK